MIEKRRLPKLRFKEFENDKEWEMLKLHEIITSSTKGKAQFNMLGTRNIYLDTDYLNGGKRRYVDSDENVRKKDVLILWDGSQAGTVYHGFEGALGSTLKVYKPRDSGSFLFYFLDKQKNVIFEQYRTPNIPHVVKDFEYEFDVFVPSYQEQEKIGEFFESLDRMIALAREKLEKLKKTKASYLSEMFPREGEDYPERRFEGFEGPWVEKKLDQISEPLEYGLNAASKEFDGENKYIRITDIDDDSRRFIKENITSPNVKLSSFDNYILRDGDILFARTGASVGKTYIYREEDGLVYYAGFLIRARIKKEFNADFIFYNTLTDKYKKYIKLTSQRSGQPGVNAKEYGEYKILLPNIKEQEKIGNFFKELDDLINLQEEKIDKLEKLKKAYLNQMFV